MHAISCASPSHVKITETPPYVVTNFPIVAWLVADLPGGEAVVGIIIRDGIPQIAVPNGPGVEYFAGSVPE